MAETGGQLLPKRPQTRRKPEAIAFKQQKMGNKLSVTRWSIDEESAEVPDGTHATAHECSFSKKIDHTSRAYEPKTVCVLSEGMTYEISAHDNEASVDTVMNYRNAAMQQRAAQPRITP